MKLAHLASLLIVLVLSFGVKANEVRVAYASDPVSLDIHERLTKGILQLSHASFDPLVRWRQDLTFEPRLAKNWQQINRLTMRIELRQGVSFHSGNAFSAKDVVWTYHRLKQSPDFKGMFYVIKDITQVDDYTIDVHTHKPYPLLLQLMTYIFPMDSAFYSGFDAAGNDKSKIERFGSSYASKHISGTGPFMLVSREKGIQISFKRNPNYWDKDSKGNIDKLSLIPIAEASTRVAALISGDVDMIAPVVPADFKGVHLYQGIELITWPSTRLMSLQLNQQSHSALKDIRVRQAIIHAINNQGIVDAILEGFGTPASQLSPPGYSGHNSELLVRYDLEKARELMRQAGFEKGLELTMMAPAFRYENDTKVALAASAMLSKIGIKVKLRLLTQAEYGPAFDRCEADILMLGWNADTEDSANLYEYLAMTRNENLGLGQYNCGHYSNYEVDSLVLSANNEIDPVYRGKLLRKVERILYDEGAIVPLHWQHLAWGVRVNSNLQHIVNAKKIVYLGELSLPPLQD